MPPAIHRVAARVILIDPAGRTLLFLGGDPHRPQDGTWWFTPGGGVDEGETLDQAARREVLEETGISLRTLGDPVFCRRIEFTFESARYDQTEHFFVARVDAHPLDDSGWTDVERRSIFERRWWSLAELRSTRQTVHPDNLADLLASAQRPR